MKKPTVAKLKKKLWTLFSLYIRRSAADCNNNAYCVTCGILRPYKELQAGHFIPGRHNSILFDERGVHPQCYRCNCMLKGNPRAYDAYMRQTYGEAVIKELEAKDREMKQFSVPELEKMILEYAEKLSTIGLA